MVYNIYNIPSSFDFADTLAKFFAKLYNPFDLKQDLILLPTRRAERRFIKLFTKYVCEYHNVENVILPKVIPVGDIDDEDILSVENNDFNIDEAFDISDKISDIPDAISYIDRLAILANLIKKKSSVINRKFDNMTWDQAFKIAMTLGSFIDTVNNEELSFDGIDKIVPDNFEQHWKEVLDFLYIIKDYWNEVLEGKIDSSKRRVLLMKKFADEINLKANSDRDFKYRNVVVAGSTGSMPFTRYLIKKILDIKSDSCNGMLILPGLDFFIDDDSWKVISSVHPQYNLKMLLAYLGCNRSDVKNITPDNLNIDDIEKFSSLISLPNDNTGKIWGDLNSDSFKFDLLNKVSVFDCESQFDEALSISLAIKDMKENSGDVKKTALVISQDRNIVKKVIANLKRFNISYDDSAGLPLNWNALGEAFLFIVRMISSNYSYDDLQIFLKNDYFNLDIPLSDRKFIVDWIEKNLLRGNRFYSDNENGLDLLRYKLSSIELNLSQQNSKFDDDFNVVSSRIYKLIDYLKDKTESLYQIKNLCNVSFTEFFNVHLDVFLKFIDFNLVDNMEISAFNEFVSDMKNKSDLMSGIKMNIDEYLSVIESFMGSYQVRENVISDDVDVIILGPIEARMQQADLVIIAGLNEGIFPKETASDPWMSRQMRDKFGLPPLEKKIGLASHDFVQFLCSSKQIILTYSKKINGAEAKPSRLMYRFSAVSQNSNLKTNESYKSFIFNILKNLDKVNSFKNYEKPNPKPPVDVRPDTISATRIETLLKDPYVFYAQNILKLNKLQDIDSELEAKDFGIIVHKAIENFVENKWQSVEQLFNEMKRLFYIDSGNNTYLYKFWEARFKQAADIFVSEFNRDKENLFKSYSEISGYMIINYNNFKYKVIARADRVDVLSDNNIRVIDYKTKKSLPKSSDLENGNSPQLVIEALILNKGSFVSGEDIINGNCSSVKYYALNGQINSDSECFEYKMTSELLNNTYEGLVKLFSDYSNPDIGYIAKFEDDIFSISDYVYLKRMKEWND